MSDGADAKQGRVYASFAWLGASLFIGLQIVQWLMLRSGFKIDRRKSGHRSWLTNP